MRLRGIRLGATGVGVVAGSFLLGLGLAWYLTGDNRMALLTGFAFAALGTLLYLVLVVDRYWTDMEQRMERAMNCCPQLTERVAQLEIDMAGLVIDMQGRDGQPTTELAAEVEVLRDMVERLVGLRLKLLAAGQEVIPPAPKVNMTSVLQGALQESRVDLYLQPIVQLPERKAVYYEAFSRLRDLLGNVIPPSDYIADAERSGLVSALDNLLLFRCINLVRKLGVRRPGVKLFVNISGQVLEDQGFLPELVDFACAHRGGLSGRVVLEGALRDMTKVSPASREHLATLSRLGFAFSIDHVTSLNSLDPAWMADMNVQYLKIDADMLLNAPCAVDRREFLERFASNRITIIATRIEDEATLIRLGALGLRYGQGYLFGEPKPARLDFDQPSRKSA